MSEHEPTQSRAPAPAGNTVSPDGSPSATRRLRGMDADSQNAALDPNQQPGFAEQDAAVQMHGGKDGCAEVDKKKVGAIEITEVRGGGDISFRVSGTITLTSGDKLTIDYVGAPDTAPKNFAFEFGMEHGLDKADVAKLERAVAAKKGK